MDTPLIQATITMADGRPAVNADDARAVVASLGRPGPVEDDGIYGGEMGIWLVGLLPADDEALVRAGMLNISGPQGSIEAEMP